MTVLNDAVTVATYQCQILLHVELFLLIHWNVPGRQSQWWTLYFENISLSSGQHSFKSFCSDMTVK